jgi:hypothetical protein
MHSKSTGTTDSARGLERHTHSRTPPIRTLRRDRRSIPVLVGWLIAGAFPYAGPGVAAGDRPTELAVSVRQDAGLLEVTRGPQKLLVYAFAGNQFKPYVRELYTLRGENVLRDAPADHLHHHGLMYAIRVNGVNFWEESPTAGHEKSVKLLSHSTGKSATGLPQATFSQLVHWVAGKDKEVADSTTAALLIERRTLTLTVDEAQQEVALRWQAEFELGPGAQEVTLTGSAYNGLGLRLPLAFDHVATHQNSEGTPYSTLQQGDVTPARWSAVSHAMDGRDVMLALFGSPTNKGETRFFTMRNAFAYLSVTQNLEKTPLEYAAGDKFSLDYLLTVYPQKQPTEFLQRRYERWLQPR